MRHHTAQLAVSIISNGYRHLQSQQSLTSRYQLDGEAEGSTVETSLNYSSSTLSNRAILEAFQSRASFRSGFAISVKVLFMEFTCNIVLCQARACGRSYLCQMSQVAVLYYKSVFIAVFTFTGTALSGVGSLWTAPAFATCIIPPRFAKPCPSVAKGSSGQLP